MSAAGQVGGAQIEIEGIPIAYEVRGEGAPILLIHGWSSDRGYMIADLESILGARRGWRRIYLDLPGHGATPAPSWLSTQDQMLSILTGFVDAILPSQPFAVVGNSYGGFLALALVRAERERLLGAALLVPDVPGPDGSRDLPDPVTIVPDPSIFTDLAADEEWIPAALPVHERRMLDEIRAHDMPGYRTADYEFLARLDTHYLLTGAVGRPGPPFDRPSLIVAGRQDSRVGYRGPLSLVEEFPRATVAVLDLGGHHVGRIERPELFGALVDDWLARMSGPSTRSAW